jgi:hypothetical protein
MIKALFVLFSGLILCATGGVSKKINVVDRAMGVRVHPGYYLRYDDTTFLFEGNKYLIHSKELFDENGEITCAIIDGDIAYIIWPRSEIYKLKDFFVAYDLDRFIKAEILDDKHIKVNSDVGRIKKIDKRLKQIFYVFKSTDTIYRITYK